MKRAVFIFLFVVLCGFAGFQHWAIRRIAGQRDAALASRDAYQAVAMEAYTERDQANAVAMEAYTERDQANADAEAARVELEAVRAGGRAILERQAREIEALRNALAKERKNRWASANDFNDLLHRYN